MPVEVPNLSKRRLRLPLTFNIHLSACSCRCPPNPRCGRLRQWGGAERGTVAALIYVKIAQPFGG